MGNCLFQGKIVFHGNFLDKIVAVEMKRTQGRRQGTGKGGNPPPPETERNVVEKWSYFRKLYF